MRRRKMWLTWAGYLLWAVFVNACVIWLINPLAEDYALLGIVAIFIIVTAWLLGLSAHRRRQWVSFTLLCLLVGQGLASLSLRSWGVRLGLTVLLCIALAVLARLFGKVKLMRSLGASLLLFVIGVALPYSEWPFLTQFWVQDYGRLNLSTADLQSLPFIPAATQTGTVAVTLSLQPETNDTFVKQAEMATDSPQSLMQILESKGHRYELEQIQERGGSVQVVPATPAVLAEIDPARLNPSFPFGQAVWTVEKGHVIESIVPAVTPRNFTTLTTNPVALASDVVAVAARTKAAEKANWDAVLMQLGIQPVSPSLQISNGYLSGTYQQQSVDVAVAASAIIGYGSFTSPGSAQVLLEGANELQVVSLVNGGTVVATYHAPVENPLPSDLVIGPLNNSGRDVIFVNSTPATILSVSAKGVWTQLYQAPNESLRFEAALKLPGDRSPEIITDDPSYLAPSPTRYFTSYRYVNHNLERNWRVYRTNVADVTPIQFKSDGPTYLLAGSSGTGTFVVLRRWDLPVVPAASVLLAIIIAGGYVVKWRDRTQARRGGVQDE